MVAIVKAQAARTQAQQPARYFLLQTQAGALSAYSRKDETHKIAIPVEVTKIVKGKAKTETVQAFISFNDYLRLSTLPGGSPITGSAPLEKGATVRAKAPEHNVPATPRKTQTIAEWADAKHTAANAPKAYPDLFKHQARESHLTIAKPDPKTLAAMFPSTAAPVKTKPAAKAPAAVKTPVAPAPAPVAVKKPVAPAPAPVAVKKPIAPAPAPVAVKTPVAPAPIVIAPIVVTAEAPAPAKKPTTTPVTKPEAAAKVLRPFARELEAESEVRTVETHANNVIKRYFENAFTNGRVTYTYDLDDSGLPINVTLSGLSDASAAAALRARIAAALSDAYKKAYERDASNPNLDHHRLQRAVLTLKNKHAGVQGPLRSHDRSIITQR